jgi:hypothetical protein
MRTDADTARAGWAESGGKLVELIPRLERALLASGRDGVVDADLGRVGRYEFPAHGAGEHLT